MEEPEYAKDEKGRFVTGNIGGGRPKGARNKLSEAFVQALAEDFEEHGTTAIATVRADKPDQYLKVIASLVPKEMTVNLNDNLSELSDDELLSELRKLHAGLAPFLGEGIEAPQGEGQPARLH